MFASKSASRHAGDWICRSCRQAQQRRTIEFQRRKLSRASLRDNQKLPETPARTRFAPSPTGYLHLGSLRTALFNFLIAKATKGQFLLRIEDTDTKRTVPGAEERIGSDLQWAGLQWDEGPQVEGPYGPYKQSQRTKLYKEHSDVLLENGNAYRCFCTTERLNQLAEQRAKLGLPTDYDRTCASISKEESDDRAHKGEGFTVRLRVPALYPEYHDIVYGKVGKKQKPGSTIKHGEAVYEDPVLMKSDGLPTYHLANVVDDHLMKITHVVRAAEWMPSTPKHLALYQAFGWKPPAFAHVGLLTDARGNKLSKRSGDIDLSSFRERGIFPEALINFSALLGWSHSRDSDFMPVQELVDEFSMKFTKGNTVVTFAKLDHLQRAYSTRWLQEKGEKYNTILDDVLRRLDARIAADPNWSPASDDQANPLDRRALVSELWTAAADKGGFETADKFLDAHRPFFIKDLGPRKPLTEKQQQQQLQLEPRFQDALLQRLRDLTSQTWRAEEIKACIDAVVELWRQGRDASPEQQQQQQGGEEAKEEIDFRNTVAKFLRRAIFDQHGPPIVLSLALLGRERSVARLEELVVAGKSR